MPHLARPLPGGAPPMPADGESHAGRWIICLGVARSIRGGRVDCPRAGGAAIDVRACPGCHLLAARSDDRDAGWECRTPDGTGTARTEIRRRRDPDR